MNLFGLSLLPFVSGHTSDKYSAGRDAALVMLLAFLLTFICVRTYTRLARIRGWRSASISGVHTHHLVFGVVIAFFAAAIEFALSPGRGSLQLILAALFGGGAAMVLDEFALAVHLQDVYWEHEGRKSVDAVIIAAIFGLLFLLRVAPFGHPNDLPRVVLTIVLLFNLLFVLVTALKGKEYFAVFGVFVPLLAVIGAIRLAEPDSIWARRFYVGLAHEKGIWSQQRYEAYEKHLRPIKEWFLDIVGGKPGRPHSGRKQFTDKHDRPQGS